MDTAVTGLDHKYSPEEEICVLFSSSSYRKPKLETITFYIGLE